MIRIGTSGWRYPEWRDGFYRGIPQRLWLSHLAAHVATIEINGSFYRLQPPSNYQKWAAQTPGDFLFAVKGSRLITHHKRLRHVEDALKTFTSSLALGTKQGPILWQLPSTLRFDEAVLRDFLAMLPPGRHALEPRHESFRTDAYFDVLRAHNVAHVVSDAPTFPCIEAVTADFAYVRLHGHDELYISSYDDKQLDEWARKIRDWDRDTYVYFDNTMEGAAPRNAEALAQCLDQPLASRT
ncbi:DUF72 domain-containing protein [Lentzea aerocolonigenes]|uniref:DUF72 domain-containing protein n=1 Tax=Lentzea aerocolonigenes TaxID=68170 RepID=UPI000564EC75|nr:DUF72 domain-containing protein [Lentzea aerocolonigenes]MCP2248823.1 Uncharacterized conserved protein YecE, DUF72 family [Lentzea aerocolonigenes]